MSKPKNDEQRTAEQSARGSDYLKAWPQYLLPGHLLSRLMWGVTRLRYRPFKDRLIDWFMARFQVDLSEAEQTDPHAYPDFNSFFVRALRPNARPVAPGASAVACPVDGAISQLGSIARGRIFQAKGRDFDLVELLGGSPQRAAPFENGAFATIYLSPRDYHRIHMPTGGRLREMVHVPGRLFSVSPATTRAVPRLFARNERVITLFDTEVGPMALVLVGAVFVAGIQTVWSGMVTPPAGRIVRRWLYEDEAIRLEKGEEMGRFNMGSTVIVLFAPNAVRWADLLGPSSPVRMGQLLAHRHNAHADQSDEETPMSTDSEQPMREPEHVQCEVCLKEIPKSVAQTLEGTDYVQHFCGLECLERWQRRDEKGKG